VLWAGVKVLWPSHVTVAWGKGEGVCGFPVVRVNIRLGRVIKVEGVEGCTGKQFLLQEGLVDFTLIADYINFFFEEGVTRS
jgi:hypothetical protein